MHAPSNYDYTYTAPQVQETFELFHETLYLAVRMVDRYLNKKNVRKLHLQLLGVTAIFLASKMEVGIHVKLNVFTDNLLPKLIGVLEHFIVF